jgi:hypothetical protein
MTNLFLQGYQGYHIVQVSFYLFFSIESLLKSAYLGIVQVIINLSKKYFEFPILIKQKHFSVYFQG